MRNDVIKILELFFAEYPEAKCSLDFGTPIELLVSTRLSAQCTDERVNIVTKTLYKKYKSMKDFANADLEELESIVKPCGFYHTKAKDIIETNKMLLEKFNGIIPDTMEELLSLPGVGRKTANLILGQLYNKPAIVADTHCIRLSNRIGFCKTDDPYKVEMALKEIIPPEESFDFCHTLVYHGRKVCNARKPKCEICCIKEYCDYFKKVENE